MNTYTVSADVANRLTQLVAGTVHIAVEGDVACSGTGFVMRYPNTGEEDMAAILCSECVDGAPPVLSALLGKRCETCGDVGSKVVGPVPIKVRCPDCAGTGVELVTLQREGMVTFGHPPQGAGYGLVSLPGRWKLESLLRVYDPFDHPRRNLTGGVADTEPWVVVSGSGRPARVDEYGGAINIDVLGSPQPGQWVATFTKVT